MTAGWRSRNIASPNSRPTTMSVMICAMKIASDGPLPPSAAHTGAAVRTGRAHSQTQRRTIFISPASPRRPAEDIGPDRDACLRPRHGPQAPDNSSGFQKFRALMQLQIIRNKVDWLADLGPFSNHLMDAT